MKVSQLIPVFAITLVSGFVLLHIPACTHDDELLEQIPPPEYEYGDDVISTSAGWNFDKAHSNVGWETQYLGASALLTGRFNSFSAQVNFDEKNPANTTILGKVVLSSVNTGEPNRDGGCLQNTFGVATQDTAYLTSKKVELDGKGGYIVTADLNFHGVVSEVIMKLSYSGITRFDENSGLGGAPFSVAGLSGEFEMNALSVFAISSTSIADRVIVRVNAQFKKPG